ncbi:hypothetical protein FRC03_012122 [Tulasnella sp. 419]|nr:hypothetical protein FRC02_012256 [Tulasnella sp. 418]KAG8952533.1 hypothetical protein FRC03_012122 [Tulasnella sp. 419]
MKFSIVSFIAALSAFSVVSAQQFDKCVSKVETTGSRGECLKTAEEWCRRFASSDLKNCLSQCDFRCAQKFP